MANRVIYTVPYDSEVEYLELTGTQWLDTGYYGDINTAMECVCKVTDTTYGYVITGSRTSATVGNISFLCGNENKQYQYMCDFGNWTNSRLLVKKSDINDYVKLYTSANLRKAIDVVSGTEYTNNYIISNTEQTPFTIKIGRHDFHYSASYKHFRGRIKSFKLWNANILLLDFIPVRVANIGYMYDKVSGKLFGNKGVGNFILGQDIPNPVPNIRRVFRFGNKRFVMPMPYDSKIEYLESSGNQYIDTGHILNGNDKVDIVYDRLGYGIIFGSRSRYNTKECSITNESGNNHKYYIKFGIIGERQILYKSNTQPTGTVSVHIESGDIKVNGTTVSTALYGSSFFNGNCFLFLINQNGSAYSGDFPQRIRSFKIEGIIDLIPVRKNGIGYMYDRVSGKLFGNSGTGQFILGNDIND